MRGDGIVFKRGNRWWIGYYAPKDGNRAALHREPAYIVEREGQAPRPARTPAEAKRALRRRRDEIGAHRIGARSFAGHQQEQITVADLLDGLVTHLELQGLVHARGGAWAPKLKAAVKPVREFFDGVNAAGVTTEALERYQQERLTAGWKPATVNRSLEGLRRAYRYAAGLSPARFPRSMVPAIPMLPVQNTRTGYFDRAEMEALLANFRDPAVQDFVEWGWLTGMRKGEIAQLTWDMVDTRGTPWVLRVPGSITKNRAGRPLALVGPVRAVIERRLKARRLDTPLVFHRMALGRVAAMTDIRKAWRNAVAAAKLPAGRLFHDLRRSAVRNLIRSGVGEKVAMTVSGHKTRSMLDRYQIVAEEETAEALLKVAAYLDAQPATRNVAAIKGRA